MNKNAAADDNDGRHNVKHNQTRCYLQKFRRRQRLKALNKYQRKPQTMRLG